MDSSLVPVLTPSPVGKLKIWDYPTDGREYVIGADVAEGKKKDRSAIQRRTNVNYGDRRPDYSSATVIEKITGLHVASWHGYLSPDLFAADLAALGLYYNTAMLVVESNGPGIAVISRLTETIGYNNMYLSRMWNVLDQDPNKKQFGFQTNTSSRKQLMMHVHASLNSQTMFTRDADLIDELRTMEFDDIGTERARGKNKDDRVFSLALAQEGRYSSGGHQMLEADTGPKSVGQSYQDDVWDKIKKKQEATHGISRRRIRNRPRWRGALGPHNRS